MQHYKLLSAAAGLILISSQAFAVPAAHKKELNEINKVIRSATTNILYKKKYDGMGEELDKAVKMLESLANKAGVEMSDSDIARAVKRIKDARKKLNKALAKMGKVPGKLKPSVENKSRAPSAGKAPGHLEPSVKNESRAPSAGKAPGKVEPSVKNESRAPSAGKAPGAVKTAAAEGMSKSEFRAAKKEINDILRSTHTDVMRYKQYDGAAEKADKAEKMLKELVEKSGKSEDDRDFKKCFSKIKDIREKLAEVENKAAFEKAAASGAPVSSGNPELDAQVAVFEKYKDDVVATYTLLKAINKARRPSDLDEIITESRQIIAKAREAHKALSDAIPSAGKFQGKYAPAKKIQFSMKLSFLSRQSDKAEKKVKEYIDMMIGDIRGDIDFMKQDTVRMKYAVKAMDRIKKNEGLLKKIAPEKAGEASSLLADAEKVFDGLKDKIAQTRMPSDSYDEDDSDEIKADMKSLYEARYGEEVLKVVITSEEWEEKAVAEFVNGDTLTAGYYKYIGAQLAAKKGGNVNVYQMTFRRTWTGDSDEFGPLEIRSVGASYPILEENVK